MNKLKALIQEQGLSTLHSATTQEAAFRRALERAKPRMALEIGTYQGASTALIAEYADRVCTIDISSEHQRVQTQLWRSLGISERIQRYVVKDDRQKADLIQTIGFDFAFIDGGHSMEHLMIDFGLVECCRNVLFHDYWMEPENWPDVKAFVDGVIPSAIIDIPFAHWIGNHIIKETA